jgi:L-fucose mutarotase/ribose pyranase (RbsD/FucU family)
MLKGIDPLLNADVLRALRAMGHGDDLIICDTNFPADSVARQTVIGKVLRIDADVARVVKAVSLSTRYLCRRRRCPNGGCWRPQETASSC